MDEDEARASLKALGDRLERAQASRPGPAKPAGGGAREALGFGLRIGLELVVAVVVSVGIGWAIDSWLGTRPAAMVVFFFLGVGAGMWNVYRAVTGMGLKVGARPSGDWNDDDED